MPERQPLPNRSCPLCGGDNACVPARCGSFDSPCWCAGIAIAPEVLARIPAAQRGQACLCARCAQASSAAPPAPR
jgi:hypothetical protein